MITKKQLALIMPNAKASDLDKFFAPLVETMTMFDIDTPLRMSHFLAQLAHESGSFRYVRELASGKAYEGRADLGNKEPGDGVKFKGRGLIQLTGRANYAAFNDYLKSKEMLNDGVSLLDTPELLEQPAHACLVSGWFWHTRKLNAVADRDDVVRVTKIINGGRNGLQERIDYLNNAKVILNY